MNSTEKITFDQLCEDRAMIGKIFKRILPDYTIMEDPENYIEWLEDMMIEFLCINQLDDQDFTPSDLEKNIRDFIELEISEDSDGTDIQDYLKLGGKIA